jgi:dUTPase
MDTDIPDFLKVPQAEREAARTTSPPPRPVPDIAVVEDPEPQPPDEFKQRKRTKTSHRLARMKQNLELNKIPLTFRQWDSRKSRWVDSRVDYQIRLKAAAQRLGITLENSAMDNLTIIPYATDNVVIERGRTTLPATAADFEIQAKMVKAVNRASLKKVERVEVINPDGTIKEQWSLDLEAKMLNKVGSEQSVPATITQENTGMATKAKKTKVAKKAKVKTKATNGGKVKVAKGPGIIDTIKETIKRERGASKDEIIAVLVKKFPDRKEASMLNTVNIQANKNAKKKDKDEKRGLVYYG